MGAGGRIALGIEYDGSSFHGWQSQRDASVPTLQERLEAALSQVSDETVVTVCAGRTDAGVHGCGQVVHFDAPNPRPARAWTLGVNSLLPPGIAVLWAAEVPGDFHARFSALWRSYRYVLLERAQRSPLLRDRAWQLRGPLDAGRMHAAAQALLGERDFSAFRGSGCQSRTPMRRLEAISVARCGEVLCIDVRANAFLLHMVRNIVGALVAVGAGEREPEWIAELLERRDRRLGAATAPAQGLHLWRVGYAPVWGLPEGPDPPFAAGVPAPW